jgi:hypothetical protein
MATLISTSGMAIILDNLALSYSDLLTGILPGAYILKNLSGSLYNTGTTSSSIFPNLSDLAEANDYYNALYSMYTGAGSSLLGSNIASNSQLTIGSNPLFDITSSTKAGFNGVLYALDSLVVKYAGSTGYTSLANYISGTGLQVSALFSALYYIVRGAYLNSSTTSSVTNVFPPTGLIVATLVSGALSTVLYPTVNGYTSPTFTDSYGNTTYVGGFLAPIGFGPCASIKAVATNSISGTCTVTVYAPNQSGVSSTWSGVLDNASAGTGVTLTPTHGGDMLYGSPTAVSTSGTASGVSLTIQTISLR